MPIPKNNKTVSTEKDLIRAKTPFNSVPNDLKTLNNDTIIKKMLTSNWYT